MSGQGVNPSTVTDTPQAPDWWQASDGRWYPPQPLPPPPYQQGAGPRQRSGCGIIAAVVGAVVLVLLLIAVVCIIAITFLGRSTSEKLSRLGEDIESGASIDGVE